MPPATTTSGPTMRGLQARGSSPGWFDFGGSLRLISCATRCGMRHPTTFLTLRWSSTSHDAAIVPWRLAGGRPASIHSSRRGDATSGRCSGQAIRKGSCPFAGVRQPRMPSSQARRSDLVFPHHLARGRSSIPDRHRSGPINRHNLVCAGQSSRGQCKIHSPGLCILPPQGWRLRFPKIHQRLPLQSGPLPQLARSFWSSPHNGGQLGGGLGWAVHPYILQRLALLGINPPGRHAGTQEIIPPARSAVLPFLAIQSLAFPDDSPCQLAEHTGSARRLLKLPLLLGVHVLRPACLLPSVATGGWRCWPVLP